MNHPANLEVEQIISATRKGERLWGTIGHLLDLVERTEYWRGNASSFSGWVRANAGELGVKEATLWRFLSAYRYYLEIRDSIPLFFGGVAPPPEEASQIISAENLELLAKLSRVLPEEMFRPLARNTLEGKTTRGALRNLWETYRPVLAGRTARGRGVQAPRVDLHDRAQQEVLSDAMMIAALLRSGPEWTGKKTLRNYTLFPQVEIKLQRKKIIFDAVALTRHNDDAPVLFHGIETAGGRKPGFRGALETISPFCDLVWLLFATPHSTPPEIPDHVGILVVDEGQVVQWRPAQLSEHAGIRSGDMAKTLLLKNLGR